MKGGVPALDLPYDHPLPPELTYRGSRDEIVIDADLAEALRRIGAAQRCSLFMVLLSAYNVLLHRLSGPGRHRRGRAVRQSDSRRVDRPRAFRQHDEHAAAAQPPGRWTPRSPITSRQMKQLVLAASEHQDYFFGNLVSKLKLPRNPARSPLFNVIFNLETGAFVRECGGLKHGDRDPRAFLIAVRAPRPCSTFT